MCQDDEFIARLQGVMNPAAAEILRAQRRSLAQLLAHYMQTHKTRAQP